VATYHHIKNNPQHHDQSTWRCGTGMCFAGWAVAIAGYDYAYSQDCARSDEVDLTPEERQEFGYLGERVQVRYFAHDLLGARMGRRTADGLSRDLFDGNNDLADIREILTQILGEDPEDIAPNEDLILNAKRVDHDTPWKMPASRPTLDG
jgi:hypothetical protein